VIVTRLSLANLRGIEAVEFHFQPGLNLIVGVNGVGKTSVLDALSVCLSAITKHVNHVRSRKESFAPRDIRIGTKALTVECSVRVRDRDYTYLLHKPLERSAPQAKKTGMPREQVHETPEKAGFVGEPPPIVSRLEPGGRPLAVLFSTNRALPSERTPSKSAAAGGISAAFADAFANRELRLGELAAWIRVQESLRKERVASARALKALRDSVARFLPGYTNLGLSGDKAPQLSIDRGRTTIPVRQLSDGERGTLALVLDLTRRLSQANTQLADPAAQASAVVLIDEIDLHLHPKWQRQIVHNLTTAFPRCQFIATTHSPQVIGEVEHHRIQIISDGKVYSPTHSYGVDSSRLLEEVMGSNSRTEEALTIIANASEAIGRQQFDRARRLVDDLERITDNPSDAEVIRLRTLIDFVEGAE
jgi:predicted ATP-binding protein involved in virulence